MQDDRFDSDPSDVLPPPPRGLPLTPSVTPPQAPEMAHAPEAREGGAWPVVPGYRVLRELGQGGMGVVYLAEDARLRRLVALKCRRHDRPGGPLELARLRTEAEAVARLQHPNVVQLFEVIDTPAGPALAQEFVPGGNLAQWAGGRPQPPATAAALVETLARAMHHAHERGVIHRDLKPANVLLGGTSPPNHPTTLQPKITDFGLARQIDLDQGQTPAGAVLGTPCYMAPEQVWRAGDQPPPGPAGDLYGLGAILYELLTGRPPLQGETVTATLAMLRDREPVPPRQLQPGVPRDLETICLKCLAKDPRRRYATAAALADDLGRYRDGRPILARPVGPGERLGKWARRRPALATLAAVVVVGTAAAGAGLTVHQARLAEALARAEANRTRAEANYQHARAALHAMLGQLHGPANAEVPQLLALGRAQKEAALTFYQEILRAEGDPDPAVRADLAEAAFDAGTTQVELGRLEPGEANLRRALRLYEGLAAQFPAAPAHRFGQARCLVNLGCLVNERPERRAEGEGYLRQALDLLGPLARDPAVPPSWRNLEAEASHDLAILYQLQERFAEAEPFFLRETAVGEALARAYPGVPDFRASVARGQQGLGDIYRLTHRPGQAADALRRAEATLEQLLSEEPLNRQHEVVLGVLRLNASYLQEDHHETAAALAALAASARRLTAVYRREPEYAQARELLIRTLGRQAQILEALGRCAAAADVYEPLIPVADAKDRPYHRTNLAFLRVAGGDPGRAAAEARDLAAGPYAADWRGLARVAQVFALAAAEAHRDPALAEGYAAEAIRLLARARDLAGPSQAAAFREKLQAADLNGLRGRSDFRALGP